MDRKKLINQSIDYIMQHLNEELSLDRISAHFFMSKYHFSRLFKAETGESVYAFVKRCKVDQSAIDLKLAPGRAITDIGLEYGYSASNYSSVFRMHHHTSPTKFRQSIPTGSMPVPFDAERTARFKTAEEYADRIELRELNDFCVIFERFIGSYMDLEKNWYQFLERYQPYRKEQTVLLERFFHDPAVTEPAQCICDICMTVEQDCDLGQAMRISGGKWIVYHYHGAIQDIFEALQGFFNVWLPQSGYQMTRPYGLNIYRRIDWGSHIVAMDLCVPVS